LRLVRGWPAVLVERLVKTLLVSDIHFGYEAELAEKGIRIPSQADRLEDLLSGLIEEVGAERIVFLGDLKHQVPLSSWIEWREMPRVIRGIVEMGLEVALIPGNHDGGVEEILGETIQYKSSKGVLLEGERRVFVIHGHAWPSPDVLEADIIVTGHLHPVVSLRTDVGSVVRRRVWLHMRGDKRILAEKLGETSRRRGGIDLLVMPAFNPILSGLSVNSLPPREKLWPLIRSGAFNLDSAEAITLSGENLGEVRILRELLMEESAVE